MNKKDLSNAIRFLSLDAVEKAKSGHPGAPMGMADIAYVLWSKFLKHNPSNPKWLNRDRFVLSNGHGSMLLYSLLHLSGYKLTIEDIKNFNIPKKKFSMAKIDSYSKTISGLNIHLIKEGLVTINIEFNNRWKALCNGRNLEIYPSNGIMMSVDAPKGCKNIELNLT